MRSDGSASPLEAVIWAMLAILAGAIGIDRMRAG